jgi:asparagine synthase (glutamine-hydrolysing)
MFQQFWRHGVFDEMDRRYFRLLDRFWGSVSLLSDDFRVRYRPEEVFARFQQIFNHPSTLSYFNKMTHFDLIAHLPALLQVEDRTSMAASLESRVPLLDHRIADLVGSVPPALKFRGAEMKYLLKRAVGEWIPPAVLTRKDKMGFPVPLHLWIRGPARTFVGDTLLSRTARERGLFDPQEVEKLLGHMPDFGRRVWGMLNLELWFRAFIDRAGRPLGSV